MTKRYWSFVFGFTVGFTITTFARVSIFDWQFWAMFFPIVIVGTIYAGYGE